VKPRLTLLDALRGFAAMWVVLFHFGEGGQVRAFQAALPNWLDHLIFLAGHSGVPVFFVLSGFVIAHSIGDDRVTGSYFGRFVLRRAIRLDLPYWLSIALTLAFAATKMAVYGRTVDAPGIGNILAHMFYLQYLLGLEPINTVYWTLCFEIQFYLLFCLLLWFVCAPSRPDTREPTRRLIFGAAAAVSIVWPVIPALQVPGLALGHWHSFLLGAFLCWHHRGVITMAWPLVYSAALLGVFAITRDTFTLACVLTGALVLVAVQRGALSTWLSQRLPQFLGRISYSLYLIHVPVSGALFAICFRMLAHTPLQEALAGVLVLAGNWIAAAIFWRIAERPATELARRIAKQ
jgi:peptidoglycan/LPS O-acetylase OafA/YrhL